MASMKRSWNEMNNSDEDEPSMGRQNLPVARLPENFEGEPMDGMQYLFLVRRDARKLPNVTRAQNPHMLPRPNVGLETTSSVSVHVKLPSEEWRAEFLRRFKNFRKNSTQATIGVEFPSSQVAQGTKLMPEKKERDKWWAFINGRPECEWNPPKKQKAPKNKQNKGMRSWSESLSDVDQYEVHYKTESTPAPETIVVDEHGEIKVEAPLSQVLLPTPSGTPQPGAVADDPAPRTALQKARASLNLHQSRQPTPSLLRRMDNRFCTHLLMYFPYWIEQYLKQLESSQPLPYPLSSFSAAPFSRLTQTHARWMFALLSRVDEQITSDEMSNLRSLARACLSIIKDLQKSQALEGNTGESLIGDTRGVDNYSESPIDERACWVIFATIAEFWGQKDLWIDAGGTLNGSV